jgi:hypothetical protein
MAVVSGVPAPPPVDPGELTFLAVGRRTPYSRDYPGSKGGLAHPWRAQEAGPR